MGNYNNIQTELELRNYIDYELTAKMNEIKSLVRQNLNNGSYLKELALEYNVTVDAFFEFI